jgi:hypothetical protein
MPNMYVLPTYNANLPLNSIEHHHLCVLLYVYQRRVCKRLQTILLRDLKQQHAQIF